MPILVILGVPKRLQTDKFVSALMQRVYAMEELNLTEDDIDVEFIPRDHDGIKNIIIFVEGLFDKPERTEELRNRLADRLAQCAKSYIPEAHLAECFIHPFDQRLGFASIK